MLLRSAPLQAAFDVWDADKTDRQPLLCAAQADATSELTAADVVEVEVADLVAAVDKRRPRITRVRPPSFARAKSVLAGAPLSGEQELDAADILEAKPAPRPSRLPLPEPPPTRRMLASMAPPSEPSLGSVSEPTLPNRAGASSIAPLAIDLEAPAEPLPLPPLSPRVSCESLADIEHAAGVPRRPAWQTALAVGVVGVTGVLVALTLSIGGAVALRRPPQQAPVVATPHAPSVLAAHEALIVPVLTASSKDELELDEPTSTTVAPPSRPLQRASTARRPLQGVLRLPPSVRGLLIDGTPHRVDRGVVFVPCGTHRIKEPSRPSRVVTVACAGTTVL